MLCARVAFGPGLVDGLDAASNPAAMHLDKLCRPFLACSGGAQCEGARVGGDTIGEARDAAESGLKRVAASSGLCFAFLAHTGLSL